MNYNFMLRKLKKVCYTFFILTFLIFTLAINVNAKNSYQYVYNNDGTKIYHYGTTDLVTVPNEYLTAEYEMRGVWVATVYNIAISNQGSSTPNAIQKYKDEFISILDRMEEYNMNTLYFQVRPSNDAFYQSEINTWSQFLAGAGVDPGWDPLEWMVNETHKRGFVFQCWLNAFRVTVYSVLPDSKLNASNYTNKQLLEYKNEALSTLPDGNFAKENPECVVMGESDTRLILNPSDPKVQQFLVDTVMEIVENYDVDGLHFDDYFYLSGGAVNTYNGNFAGGKYYDSSLVGSKQLNDLPNYQAYLNNDSKYSFLERGLNLGDFRRANLNNMIKSIYEEITKYNELNNDCVEFGAKPTAVWRSNISNCYSGCEKCTENGSNTHPEAYSSYNDLFADTLTWVENGWVDYIAPQVYFGFNSKEVPYADIVKWWAEQVERINKQNVKDGKKEIKLYIAHGIYKYEEKPNEFYFSDEVMNQLYYNQKFSCIKGSAFYSYEHLYQFASDTHKSAMNLIKKTWSSKTIPLPVGNYNGENLIIDEYEVKNALGLNDYSISFDLVENASVYAVYKVLKGNVLDISDVTSRIIVEFEGYQENKKLSLKIIDYDNNYDYYIKIFSNQYHVSQETLKIDFSKSIEFIPIDTIDNIEIPSVIKLSTLVDINLNVKYNAEDTLTYEIYLIDDDYERVLSSGILNGDELKYSWKSYPVKMENLKIKVVLYDKDYQKIIYSNSFDLKNIFNINYELDGGILDNPITEYYEGEGINTLPIPSKDGYNFVGWFLYGKQVTSIDSSNARNITLVAKWEKQKSSGCKKKDNSILLPFVFTSALILLTLRKKDN